MLNRVFSSTLVALVVGLLAYGAAPFTGQAQSAEGFSPIASEQAVVNQTAQWEGERYPDGRPKVPDELLERMEIVKLEVAWSTARDYGYHNQVPGYGQDWVTMDPDEPLIGRALTAQYMPARPAYEERLEKAGEAEGFEGPANTWPIQMLQNGDVYVADGFGKIRGGTLIGDRLGNDIYSRSGNGVVFNGSVRDIEGLKEIDGWNHYIRGSHPSFIMEMMLEGVNVPIRIGEATVLPGDVVLAVDNGIVFIPPRMVREAVRESEIAVLTDEFAHVRMQEGVYSSGQMDTSWTEEIRNDFYGWLEENKEDLPVPAYRIEEIIEKQPID